MVPVFKLLSIIVVKKGYVEVFQYPSISDLEHRIV